MSTRTGFDGAPRIPIGATVARAYWAVPTSYTAGSEYPTEVEAIRAAIARWEDRDAAHAAEYGPERIPFPQRLTVDLRWHMVWPPAPGVPTSGIDATVYRTVYENVAEAREHVTRIEKYASVAP